MGHPVDPTAPATGPPTGPVTSPRASIGEVLGMWVASRVAVLVTVSAAAWLLAQQVTPWPQRWERWDTIHYLGVAEFGYGGEPTGVPNEAFFPGLPALLWLGAQTGVPMLVVGLLISFVAGGAAAVALARLAEAESPGVGRAAVLAWVVAPPAVFLAAAYTEALFCALAFWAWLRARRGAWPSACLLGAAASTVRISGLFLAAALVVEWLTRPGRRWTQVGWLLLPVLPILGYFAYLRGRLGSWTAWFQIQAEEWNRGFTLPWDSLRHTLQGAQAEFGTDYTWMFRAEIAAIAVGVAVTGWLLARRRWGESMWVGSQVAAFATSYWFMSVPRATLLWWPLWVGLAVLAQRRGWVLVAYVSLAAPLSLVWAATFTSGRWAG